MARRVSKEESQLRLTAKGRFFHEGEPVENERISQFFHRAIRRDADGNYYLYNTVANLEEHVYFEVEDTAFFVRSVGKKDDLLSLGLNNEKEEALDAGSLESTPSGLLYCRLQGGDRARFTQRAVTQLSAYAEMDERGVFLVDGRDGSKRYVASVG